MPIDLLGVRDVSHVVEQHVLIALDDADLGVLEMRGQPIGGDERFGMRVALLLGYGVHGGGGGGGGGHQFILVLGKALVLNDWCAQEVRKNGRRPVGPASVAMGDLVLVCPPPAGCQGRQNALSSF